MYGDRLLRNARQFAGRHNTLYLGAEALQPFRDWRLLNFWTYKQLPEVVLGAGGAQPVPPLSLLSGPTSP